MLLEEEGKGWMDRYDLAQPRLLSDILKNRSVGEFLDVY
jgi:hypothetical protein